MWVETFNDERLELRCMSQVPTDRTPSKVSETEDIIIVVFSFYFEITLPNILIDNSCLPTVYLLFENISVERL